MTDAATKARQVAQHCEAKKHALRQTQDGIVVAFVLHPNDVPPALQLAPLGTRYMLALVELNDDETPIDRKEGDAADRTHNRTPEKVPAPESASPDAPVRARSPAQRAGILCNDRRFWAFLREDRNLICEHEEHAASYVRGFCEVQSRSEIRLGTVAEQRFNMIDSAFTAWSLVA